jgi:hypothetical protein
MNRGEEIVKLLCYHGFSYIKNIVTLCTYCCNKRILNWGLENLFIECCVHFHLKKRHHTGCSTLMRLLFPSRGLLGARRHHSVTVFSFPIDEDVFLIDTCMITVTYGYSCLVCFYFDASMMPKTYNRQSLPDSYLIGEMQFIYDTPTLPLVKYVVVNVKNFIVPSSVLP